MNERENTPSYPVVGPGSPPEGFDEKKGLFRKVSLTEAMRMEGPFVVMTSEGPLSCQDGWVAKDARGYFYPIAADEFEKIYVPVGDEGLEVE